MAEPYVHLGDPRDERAERLRRPARAPSARPRRADAQPPAAARADTGAGAAPVRRPLRRRRPGTSASGAAADHGCRPPSSPTMPRATACPRRPAPSRRARRAARADPAQAADRPSARRRLQPSRPSARPRRPQHACRARRSRRRRAATVAPWRLARVGAVAADDGLAPRATPIASGRAVATASCAARRRRRRPTRIAAPVGRSGHVRRPAAGRSGELPAEVARAAAATRLRAVPVRLAAVVSAEPLGRRAAASAGCRAVLLPGVGVAGSRCDRWLAAAAPATRHARPGSAEARSVQLQGMRYYLTTPIYYVNSTPHIGHAYTTIAADILARHQRQRGDDTFFLTGVDEHASKVARVAAEQGLAPQEYADRIVESSGGSFRERLNASQRLLHPHERRRAQAVRPGIPPAHLRQRRTTSTRTSTRGCTASAARRSRPRRSSSTASAPSTTPSRSGSRSATGSSASPPTRSRCSSSTTSGPTSSCRRSVRTRRAASSRAGSRTSRSAAPGQTWGIPIPWDPEQVAYVWADALVNYLSALTYARPARTSSDVLAGGPAPAREGHPPLPLRLLARAAARGRLRASAAAVRPRLPAPRRPEDLEVARQRRRPARPRSTSTAPMRCASGARGRSRSARTATASIDGRPRALRARARQRSRQPALADDGDDRPLPRTARSRARPADVARRRGARAARRRRRARLDALRHHGRARADLGGRARASTATSRRPRRGSSQRTRRGRTSSTGAVRPRRRPARRRRRARARTCRRRAGRILTALGQPPDARLGRASPTASHRRGRAGSSRRRRSSRGSTQPRPRRDRHPRAPRRRATSPPRALVERARAAGVTRIVTVGTGIDSCRAALAIADASRGRLRGARDRPAPGGDARGERASTSCGELLAHPRAVAVGETGLDGYHDRDDARPSSARSSTPSSTLAAEAGLPVVIHTREADEETAAALAAFAGTVVLHCFSAPELLDAGARARLLRLVRGQRHVPEGRRRSARPPRVVPGRPDPRRDRQPVPRAAAAARPAERAGERRATRSPRSRTRAGRRADELERRDRRERDRGVRARCREPAVVPKKALGQHFLVDDNILGVIERLAELDAGDVVLEIGPGLGVLTRFLAERVRARPRGRARPLARAARSASIAGATNVALHWGDALAARPRRARAAARRSSSRTCRTTSRRRSSPRASTGCRRSSTWCVMVQREVADRFFAVPSTKAYGAVSVLVQLAAAAHRVPPGLPHGLPAAAERRLRARRVPAHPAPGAIPRRPAGGRGGIRPPAQDARRTRSRSPASRRATQAVGALAALGLDPASAPRRSSRPCSSS